MRCHLCLEIRCLQCADLVLFLFFFRQTAAYVMRISDWGSDVCSSDLVWRIVRTQLAGIGAMKSNLCVVFTMATALSLAACDGKPEKSVPVGQVIASVDGMRSEEHTSELQSLMRISYAVFCLKKKRHKH